jgi:dipeptidyl aminopeptidase/acylaminoacyl peptidase
MSAKPDAGLLRPGAMFLPEDLLRYELITSIHGVRGSDLAAYAVTTIDAAEDTYASAIWMHSRNDGNCFPLTRGQAYDKMPRLSPDGSTVAFISDRDDEVANIFLISANGGDVRKVTRFEDTVVAAAWSPEGTRLLATVDVDRSDAGPEVAWRLPYKADASGYTLSRETHLFLVDAVTGQHRQLTHGAFEVRNGCWSPDGKRVAYTRSQEGRLAHRIDLWAAGADGKGETRLTNDIPLVQGCTWSPDGRWIVFGGSDDDGSSLVRLYAWDVEKGEAFALGDDSIEVVNADFAWSDDSREVAFLLAHRGRQVVAAMSVPDAKLRHITPGDRHVSHLATCGNRLAFGSQTLAGVNQVFIAGWKDSAERQVSHLNTWWEKHDIPEARAVSFDVPDGEGKTERIEGWLLSPGGARGALPLLVDAHGGPASYVLFAYTSHPYWYALCSMGWRVLALNPVGSSSFGKKFATRLNGRWGELDLPQHLAAVKSLQRDGLADSRIAIYGKSYGGYMSSWAIGHTHDFRAAVVVAPVTNLESHFGTSDSGYYADAFVMNGMPWEQRELYRRLSPMQYAHTARTPTLILQGKDDERCQRSQSEELFTALMVSGKTPARMATYPKGSHHFLEDGRPSYRVDAVKRMVDWLQEWVT